MWNIELNNIGVISKVVSTERMAIPPNYDVMSLIEVENQNVDLVRVLKRRFNYTIAPRHTQSELVELIIETGLVDIGITKTKLSRSFPFFGKVIGFRWSGGRLAKRLNNDTELNQRLTKCLGEASNVRIMILPQPLQGYLAIVVPRMPPTCELWSCYNRIARYIREEIEP